MSTYPRQLDGAWFQPVRRGFKLACCNCGVVHLVDLRIVHRHIQMRAKAANRSTALMRRHKAAKK